MSFKIKDIEMKNNICLAPMAGICNKAFRLICKKYDVGLIYSEMVSDKALLFKNQKTIKMIEVDEKEHPISIQVFGGTVEEITEAAMFIDKNSNCDIIDINMGCPVPKVAKKSGAGAALLRDVELIEKIVYSVVNNVSKPVTVKIRSGWDFNSINAVEVAQAIERAGASAICIHGRTRSQLYTGNVDLNIIKEVKEAVKIPVIGNGDIKTKEDAKHMLEYTKCDAIMIGRGSLGNPFIFKQINNYLNGLEDFNPTIDEVFNTIKEHFDLLHELKGEKIACLEMRSHLAWYVKGYKHANDFKKQLFKLSTRAEIDKLLSDYYNYLTKE
jgi:nifR3 family TIM-barrel protein